MGRSQGRHGQAPAPPLMAPGTLVVPEPSLPLQLLAPGLPGFFCSAPLCLPTLLPLSQCPEHTTTLPGVPQPRSCPSIKVRPRHLLLGEPLLAPGPQGCLRPQVSLSHTHVI